MIVMASKFSIKSSKSSTKSKSTGCFIILNFFWYIHPLLYLSSRFICRGLVGGPEADYPLSYNITLASYYFTS